MYTEIIPKIKSVLEGVVLYEVDGIEYKPVIYPYPLEEGENPKKYPAIMFFPTNMNNDFSTTAQNFKQINFTAILLVSGEKINQEKTFTEVMPNAVDVVIKELDKGWDFGDIDGCRTWSRADATLWGVDTNQSGRYAFAEINIIIKLQTNNE